MKFGILPKSLTLCYVANDIAMFRRAELRNSSLLTVEQTQCRNPGLPLVSFSINDHFCIRDKFDLVNADMTQNLHSTATLLFVNTNI